MNRYRTRYRAGQVGIGIIIALSAVVILLTIPGCTPLLPYPYTYELYPKYEGRRLDRHFVDPEIIEHARDAAEILNDCGRTRIRGAWAVWSTAKYEETIIVEIDVCNKCKQYRWMGWQGRHHFVEQPCKI